MRIIQPDKLPSEVETPEIEDSFPPRLIRGWEERDEYPGSEEAIKINEFTLDNKGFDRVYKRPPREDKLAGWPSWVQFPEYQNCPTCKSTMNQFIFQIESGENIFFTWGDAGEGYLIQCPEHKEQVAFLWQCH
ncbi:MAG: hypothetical protein AB1861_07570 [Cyanobacteriota bacterium]